MPPASRPVTFRGEPDSPILHALRCRGQLPKGKLRADRRVKSSEAGIARDPAKIYTSNPGRSMRSLVIEDEPQSGPICGRLLVPLQGSSTKSSNPFRMPAALRRFKYDLAIFDRMLPERRLLDIVPTSV